MDIAPEGMTATAGRRPADLARLCLAAGFEPPRACARDQQADRAGGDLRRKVLDRLAALDPEPEALVQVLEALIPEFGEPTGPTRAACTTVLDDWEQASATPGLWEWLLSEALERSQRDGREGPRRGGSRGVSG